MAKTQAPPFGSDGHAGRVMTAKHNDERSTEQSERDSCRDHSGHEQSKQRRNVGGSMTLTERDGARVEKQNNVRAGSQTGERREPHATLQ
jgi:hypothetical protein